MGGHYPEEFGTMDVRWNADGLAGTLYNHPCACGCGQHLDWAVTA